MPFDIPCKDGSFHFTPGRRLSLLKKFIDQVGTRGPDKLFFSSRFPHFTCHPHGCRNVHRQVFMDNPGGVICKTDIKVGLEDQVNPFGWVQWALLKCLIFQKENSVPCGG